MRDSRWEERPMDKEERGKMNPQGPGGRGERSVYKGGGKSRTTTSMLANGAAEGDNPTDAISVGTFRPLRA